MPRRSQAHTKAPLPNHLCHQIIPGLQNWEDILYLTDPTAWTPHAMYAATKVFASNLNAKMAQRFYNLVLLPCVCEDIEEVSGRHHRFDGVAENEGGGEGVCSPSRIWQQSFVLIMRGVEWCAVHRRTVSHLSRNPFPFLLAPFFWAEQAPQLPPVHVAEEGAVQAGGVLQGHRAPAGGGVLHPPPGDHHRLGAQEGLDPDAPLRLRHAQGLSVCGPCARLWWLVCLFVCLFVSLVCVCSVFFGFWFFFLGWGGFLGGGGAVYDDIKDPACSFSFFSFFSAIKLPPPLLVPCSFSQHQRKHTTGTRRQMADMDYNGATTIFLAVLIDKKYSLPKRVVIALVNFFVKFGFRRDIDLPVLWHKCLLVFVQRYRSVSLPLAYLWDATALSPGWSLGLLPHGCCWPCARGRSRYLPWVSFPF